MAVDPPIDGERRRHVFPAINAKVSSGRKLRDHPLEPRPSRRGDTRCSPAVR